MPMSDSDYLHHATLENFTTLVLEASQNALVLVDFWAPWCGPCQMLMPILEKLANEYQGKLQVVKINTDEQQAIAQQFGIRSLPTVKLFHNQQIVDEFMGVQPEQTIRQMLEQHMDKPADNVLLQARQANTAGDYETAQTLLQKQLAEDDNNLELQLELATVYCSSGNLSAAQEMLDQVPLQERNSDAVKLLTARLEFASASQSAPDLGTLNEAVASQPDDLQSRYHLGVRQVLAGDHEHGLQQFLEIIKRDRHYQDGLGRKSLLAAFQLVDNPRLVSQYRQRMAAMLF